MVPYNQLKPHQLPPFIKLRNTDGTESIHYSIFYDGVPDEFKKVARIELNETEEKKTYGMQMLRKVLKREGISGVDNNVLICCLRKCKYNFSKAETHLLKYVKVRNRILDDLRKADLKKLEHVLDHNVVGFLPYRDKEGRAIFFSTPNIDLDIFDMEDAVLCFYFNLAFILSFPMTSIAGTVYIAESKPPKLAISYAVMKTFRRHLDYLASLHGRIARVEVLNENFIVRWTVNLLKPILAAKIVERINFYGSDVINLRKTYHPDLLPDEFGGTLGPLNNTLYKEELMNFIKRARNENAPCNRNY